MLSIQPVHPRTCTPHLLPVGIEHDGPVRKADQYWQPQADESGTQHAYFRGRHLRGHVLPLPAKYTGMVLQLTDTQLPQPKTQGDSVQTEEVIEDSREYEDVNVAKQIASFEDIRVWGHGGKIDDGQDVYTKALKEWVDFAESAHVEADEMQGKEIQGALKIALSNAP